MEICQSSFFSLDRASFEFNFHFLFSPRPSSNLLEWPWSEKCLTLGDDVTNYLLGVLFRVTLLLPGFRVIFYYPLDFGLGMCWSCIGGLWFMSCHGSWSLRVLGRNTHWAVYLETALPRRISCSSREWEISCKICF